MSYEIEQHRQGNTYSLHYWKNYVTVVTQKFATFSGRATRGEYWRFFLMNVFVAFIVAFVEVGFFEQKGHLSDIYSLAVFIPGLALSARRLHDVNKSAWWLLMHFLPLFGTLYLLYLSLKKGDVGPNRFGEDPMPLD